MATANPDITEIIATTLRSRSGKIADNVSRNNALLTWIKSNGGIKTFSGGRSIVEELSFAANANATWYSGGDTLPTGTNDVLTGAEYSVKQLTAAVVMTGLEGLQNSGKEAIIDLLEARIANTEATLANMLSEGLYSDGTTYGGLTLTGLAAAVPTDPTTGTYGGINRATYTFWRSQVYDPPATPTTSTIQGYMNTLWTSCVRGADAPDLILAGSTIGNTFLGSLQPLQRFTSADTAKLGFATVQFMTAPVVIDGGIGGYATTTDMYFLNTKYIRLRPHAKRNMVPLEKRNSVNQDASIQYLAWAGNLTCSGSQFQGRLIGT